MKLPLYMDENNDIYDANHKLLVSGTHTEVETGIGMLSKYEPVDKKTAEFFVKAVNNYESLLGALKKAIWMLERDYIDPQKRQVIEYCQQAIEKGE